MERSYYTESFKKEKEEVKEKEHIDGVEINENVRAPICCVMGHVDAGKTSFLDKIRESNYQKGEAGGITQTIGSTFFPIEHIREVTKHIQGKFVTKHTIPGILIIDTPGHEEFKTLRERGASMCDLGIIVIDIEKSIEPQTIESIKLLRENKVPFIVVANKLDTIDGWEPTTNTSLKDAMKSQNKQIAQSIEYKMEDIKYDLSKIDNIKAEFYFKNKTPEKQYSIVPMSSRTGEGISDIFALLVYLAENLMMKKLTNKEDKFKAYVMETIKDKQNGWVIDTILVNGKISVDDKIVLSTMTGQVVSTIRNIMVPEDLKQLGKKTNWKYVDSISASRGVRLIGSNFQDAMAGTQLFQLGPSLSEQEAIHMAKDEQEKYWKSFEWKDNGVFIHANTLAELDALYHLLSKNNINVTHGKIHYGNINEKDLSIIESMLSKQKFMEYRTILYFGKLDEKSDAHKIAKSKNIHIIESEVMYKLIEIYNNFKAECLKTRKEEETQKGEAVFPVQLSIIKKYIFMKGGADHLLFGVKVKKGKLYLNTPIIVGEKKLVLGKVTSIQKNHKEQKEAEEGDEVCIRLSNDNHLTYERQFDSTDILVSHLTRDIIDTLKRDFRDVLTNKDWTNVIEIKQLLEIK